MSKRSTTDECLDTVAELALHLPAGARLALATRADPPLPMPRLRAGGEIVEIGVDDLAMNNAEARSLLRTSRRRAERRRPRRKVIARTEGWPVGLYLAALALRAGGSRQAAGIPSPATTGSSPSTCAPRSSTRYHGRSAVSRRDVGARSYVGHLCDAVLEGTGSAERARVARAFEPAARRARSPRRVVSLSPLVSRSASSRTHPPRAGDHHHAPDSSVEIGAKTTGCASRRSSTRRPRSDAERTNRLLLTYAGSLYGEGRAASLHRWMTWFDDRDLVARYPRSERSAAALQRRVAASATRTLGGRPNNRPTIRTATASCTQGAGSRASRRQHARGWMAVMRLVLCREGTDGATGRCSDRRKGLSVHSGYRASALAFESLAVLAAAEAERADALFCKRIALALDTLRLPAAIVSAAMRGFVATGKGDWSRRRPAP